ncbi:hypothetical protein BGZ89_005381 [Linnemannia elongata]|nr:hypothetical protein BGZ89_005381 [Linnemannia elongata]
MGNTKSRHQQQQQQGQYYQKSSSRNGTGNDRVRASKYINTSSSSSRQQQQYNNQQQQSPLLNDSGHYSIHGFLASPSSPIDRSDTATLNAPGGGLGWNHPNLSSPGRLDQTKKPSDSSLHYQFQNGTRNNINSGNSKGAGSGHPSGPSAGAGGGTSRLSGGIRMSGTMPRTSAALGQGHDGLNDGYGYDSSNYHSYSNNNNVTSGQEMSLAMHSSSQQQQQQQQQTMYNKLQQQQQGPDQKSLSIPPHHLQANGRMSQQQHHYPTDANTGMRSSVSIPNNVAAPYTEEGIMASSIAAMNLTDRQQQQQQQQQQLNMRIQNQYQDHQQRNSAAMPPYHYQQGSANNSRQGSMLNVQGVSPTPLAQPYYQQQQQQPRLTTTYPAEPQRDRPSINNGPNTTTPKPSAFLASAGPLIDMGPSPSSQRPPTADQVFARLARQFPTNPRETEKRERIYRWLGHIVESLTFNPDTETPGFIIPVYPDELDHPESPFYVDRITYELDLMAPIAKPFRKAIDINCASGDWAMDMAIKHPRTLVYALDSLLDTAHLPLRIPENCKFRMRDARDQEGEFDLVHQRLGAFRTPIQEWTPHFAEMRRLTRPGGWIQMAESDGMVVRAGLETAKVNRWVEQAALSSGLNPPQLMGALMPTVLGAGLINVECYDYSIPLGEWAGLRGQVAMRSYLDMVESLKEEIIDMNRLEEGLFEETMEMMKMECQDEKAELIMRVICAQKPPVTDDLWRTTR